MSQSINIYKNVNFFIGEEWGDADYNVVCYILKSVIEAFENEGFDQGTMRNLNIMHSLPFMDCPKCCGNEDMHMIFLHTSSNYWSQYVYQFAHEFCHHAISGPLDGSLEASFWFEESICELASCYFMEKVIGIWRNSPDTPLNLRGFVQHHIDYINEHLNGIDNLNIPLKEWILMNLDVLQKPVYQRDMYEIIAKSLLGVFKKHPRMWLLLPYFIRVVPEVYVSFDHWLNNVIGPQVPDNLRLEYVTLLETLL